MAVFSIIEGDVRVVEAGVSLATDDNAALVSGARGFITVGFDGTNTRFIRVDTSGRLLAVGAGVAGTPAGGVFSVQGVAGGTALPISAASLPLPTGAATEATLATRLSEATFTTRIPILGQALMSASVPVVVASDQSRLPIATELQYDFDTGVGIQKLSVIGLALPGAGGFVVGGTATAPLRTDPTGTTTQPVSGTVTANAGAGTFNVAGTVTSNQGNAGTHAQRWMVGLSDGAAFISPATDRTSAPAPFAVRLSDGTAFYKAPTEAQLPSSLVGGRLDTNVGAWLGSTAPTVGQKAMASSVPVVIASDQTEVQVKQGTAASLGGAWPVKHTDGTNTMPTGDAVARGIYAQIGDGTTGPATVKEASAAPAAADKALVVVISPNQQALPVSSTPANTTAGLRAGRIILGGGTSGSLNAIRGTAFVEQTTDAQRSIASASANDTSAGSGARTVELTYFDQTGAGPYTETLTLNGTTPVNTVNTNICFIESIVVLTAGAGGTNAGVVSLYAATGGGGGAIASIGTGNIVSGRGDGRTLYAQHYVPAGKTLSITGLVVGATASSAFHLKAKPVDVADAAEIIISSIITTAAAFTRTYGSPIGVDGPARVTMYGVPSANNVALNGAIDFFES